MLIRSRLLQVSSLILLSVTSFLSSLPNERVWDDDVILGARLAPESVSSPLLLWREPYWDREPRDGFRPLGLTLLYLQRRVFKESMLGFRLVSLLLHSLTSLVLLRVFRRIATERAALLAALLFAIHPAHAEAVAMAYGQLELLMALFALLAIDQYLVADLSSGRLGAAVVFAFLSASSKESGLMLPWVLVLLRGLYLKPGDRWATRWFTGREAMFLLPGIVYLAMRHAALGSLLAAPESTITYGYPAAVRLNAFIVSLGNAIRLSIFPTQQSLYYGHLRDHLMQPPWTELAWIGAGTLLCWVLAREIGSKAALFGAGWFLIWLFPVLNIIPTGVLVAERNLYLPLAAVVFLAANVGDRLVWNRVAYGAAAALTAVCVIDSNLVVRQWRDKETLWRTTVNNYPTSPMAHAALGEALLDQAGREDEAERYFERALQLNREVAGAKHGMAKVAMRRGDYRRALRWLEQAERSDASPAIARDIDECRRRITARH
jgi:tetratricopeptide (TPR) repeat protein